jgi:hypothetical protein
VTTKKTILRPGDPGYLEAIPDFDLGAPPTLKDGTVESTEPAEEPDPDPDACPV